jgi:hypothetical protein
MKHELPPDSLTPLAERIATLGSELKGRDAFRRAASWQVINGRVMRARTQRAVTGWSLALASCAGIALLVGARVGHPLVGVGRNLNVTAEGWRDIDLGAVGRLSLGPGARVRLPTPEPGPGEAYRVTLDEGQICAQVNHRDPVRQGPFLVEAEGLLVTVVGTRFCVYAGHEPSWVSVDEGRVRVEARGSPTVAVSAGESVHADDPRFQPIESPIAPAPAMSVPAVSAEMAVAEPTSSHRYVSTAVPTLVATPPGDLGAENFLYEQGLRLGEARDVAGSLAVWDQYHQRFPHGVFAAEVDVRRVRAFTDGKDYAQALSAAEEFEQAHPGDWRDSEVQLIRADLLREQFSRPASAAPVYERVLSTERRGALRDRALYGLYLSLDALSRYDEARVRAHEYLRQFPHGAHAAELSRLVKE